MSTTILSRIIKIGNSQGIRIPKLLLEQSNLGEAVELVLGDNQIIVRPSRQVRHDWDDAFKTMAENGDDGLPDDDPHPSTAWDEEEWAW